MTSRQYIKVKASGTSNPDPAVYCPLNGYVPDPTVYVPDEVVDDTPTPGDGEIWLTISDQGMRRVRFSVYTSTGDWNCKVYGAGGALIDDITIAGNSYIQYDVPLGQGVDRGGYTTYTMHITPVSGNLTRFWCYLVDDGYTDSGAILVAKFKCPNFINLDSLFENNPWISHVEFLGSYDLATSANESFKFCRALKHAIMPLSMAVCTEMLDTFYETSSLISIDMAGSYPSVTTMSSFIRTSGIKTFTIPDSIGPTLENLSNFAYQSEDLETLVMPTSLPVLVTLNSAFYGCKRLKTITLPGSMPLVTTLNSALRDCDALEGEIIFPAMPLLDSMQYVMQNCKKVTKIHFTGPCDVMWEMRSAFINCESVLEVKLPETLGNINDYGTPQVFSGCQNIQKIIMPSTSMELDSATIEDAFFNGTSNLYNLTEITTCPSWPTNQVGMLWSGLKALTRFDQPDARIYRLDLSGSSALKVALNYVEIDWDNLFLNYGSLPSPTPLFDFGYTSIDMTELTRIIASLPSHPAVIDSYRARFTFTGSDAQLIGRTASSTFYAAYGGDPNKPQQSYGDSIDKWVDQVGNRFCTTDSRATERTVSANSGTFTKTNHQMPNGTPVSLREITGLTGISPNTKYYVVNTATDTFQLSETEGGSAIAFTGNDTTLKYCAFPMILAVNNDPTNDYITIDFPWDGWTGDSNVTCYGGPYSQQAIEIMYKGYVIY
nr:leucine-rich repeat protein [uncultured Draconibacterium sp.]